MNGCQAASVAPVFGRALSSPASEWLRRSLDDCLPHLADGIRVDTFFELMTALNDGHDCHAARSPTLHLIFDLQRLICFRDSGLSSEPGIASLLLFLQDGYSLQPFDSLAGNELDRPYRFAFDPAVLDILSWCLADLACGEYLVVDLLDGQILSGYLVEHPESSPARTTRAVHPPALDMNLPPVTTNRTLRLRPPPHLDDLLGSAAGVIREESVRMDPVSLVGAVTLLNWNKGARTEACYGKALLMEEARAIGRCEATERFQVAFPPPGVELVRGTYAELSDYAIDPRALFLTGKSADESIADISLSWTWAWGIAEAAWRLIPAQEIWFNMSQRLPESRIIESTTSGCAVGSSTLEAAVFAVLETIERDATMTSWYLRRPVREIDFDSFRDDKLRMLVDRFRLNFPGYRPVLFDLTSDTGVPTIGGLAIRERGYGPRAYSASATHIDAERACYRALSDLTTMPPEVGPDWMAEIRRRAHAPGALRFPRGHCDLFALDESFGAVDYLQLGQRKPIPVTQIGGNSPVPTDSQLRLDQVLESLSGRLSSLGAAVYIKDLTHPVFATRGLHAARAVTPGLFPLWFGKRASRFRITDRLRRLAEIYTGQPFDADRLQLDTHHYS